MVANSRVARFIGFLVLASCTLSLPSNLRAQEKSSIAIMPLPAHVVQGEGEFLIDGGFGIALKGYKDARLERAQQRFLDTLSRETGSRYGAKPSSTHRTSQFKLRDRVPRSSSWARMSLTTWRSQLPMFS